MSKKQSWQKRKERIANITKSMDEAIEGYYETPEQMKEFLNFMARFYNYSPRNSALIRKQFRGAQAVGSYKFWQEKGFQVKKGEKGIEVLVPNKTAPKFKDINGKWKNIKYATEKEKEMIENGELEKRGSSLYYSVGHVFDVSQTTAKASDLPEIFPNRWLEGQVENYDAVMDALQKIGNDLDVTIGEPFEELGSAKGAFYLAVDQSKDKNHIGLNPRNSELQNVKTLIHELAHAKLHSGDNKFQLSSEEKEFQAEMTAYSVASYFGIDTSDYSLAYLANWTKGKKLRDKSELLNEVRETAIEFIGTIENELIKNKEMVHEQQKDSEKQLSAINTERILNQFYDDCFQFWKKEKERGNISDNTSSIEELALNDVRNVKTNPFSVKGQRLDVETKENWIIEKQNSLSKKEEIYWYEMTARPVDIGCQPKGFVDFANDKGRHGIVAYDRELTEKELNDFEMKPYQESVPQQKKEKVGLVKSEMER